MQCEADQNMTMLYLNSDHCLIVIGTLYLYDRKSDSACQNETFTSRMRSGVMILLRKSRIFVFISSCLSGKSCDILCITLC